MDKVREKIIKRLRTIWHGIYDDVEDKLIKVDRFDPEIYRPFDATKLWKAGYRHVKVRVEIIDEETEAKIRKV